jgi:hypothetical protein
VERHVARKSTQELPPCNPDSRRREFRHVQSPLERADGWSYWKSAAWQAAGQLLRNRVRLPSKESARFGADRTIPPPDILRKHASWRVLENPPEFLQRHVSLDHCTLSRLRRRPRLITAFWKQSSLFN